MHKQTYWMNFIFIIDASNPTDLEQDKYSPIVSADQSNFILRIYNRPLDKNITVIWRKKLLGLNFPR